MGETYVGEIKVFAGLYVPSGWIVCDGRQLVINNYQLLYAVIGNQFGGSQSQGSFNVPDLRGRVAVGAGQGTGLQPWAVGQAAGAEGVTLTEAQMPPHSHTVSTLYGPYKTFASSFSGTPEAWRSYPSRYIVASGGPSQTYAVYATASDTHMNPGAIQAYHGGSYAHENLQPYLPLTFAINATAGLYPNFD